MNLNRLKTVAGFIIILALPPSVDGGAEGGPPAITNRQLLYSNHEKLHFSVDDYLAENAPHLLPHAEAIRHWSAYTSVSPKVVLALMQTRSGALSGYESEPLPFPGWSSALSFSAQLEEVLMWLSETFSLLLTDENSERAEYAAEDALVGLFFGSRKGVADLGATLAQFFPRTTTDEAVQGGTLPPWGLLQLPFPRGQTWYHGGAHTGSGSDPGPKSSLDFMKALGVGWGDPTSTHRVVAAHGGRAVRHSRCFVEVIGIEGWSTQYYHLENPTVATGQIIDRNEDLAHYANDRTTALCNGGHSTGPHVHFSLLRNGVHQDLLDVALNGYKVHPGRYSYDTDCNYFWLARNGVKHCAWRPLTNDGGGLTGDGKVQVLTLDDTGSGSGTYWSTPGRGTCNQSAYPPCTTLFATGTRTQLEAEANAVSYFAGWEGEADCTDGVVTMQSHRSCVARFEPLWYLSVTAPHNGRLVSSPQGIDCAMPEEEHDCEVPYPEGTVVTLAAIPDLGFEFSYWAGDCVDGVVTMEGPFQLCTATFSPCSIASVVDVVNEVVDADSTYEACNVLNAVNVSVVGLGTNVLFRAGNTITLGNGFVVGTGTHFEARIGGE